MTLIELMVVVSIIGISLLAFTPSFIRAMADRRCATATMELARLGRRARSEAIGLSRAMLVNIAYGRSPNQTARMRLLRGNVTHCDAEDWVARDAVCPANNEIENGGGGGGGGSCLESVDLDNTHWYHSPFAITVGMWLTSETPLNQTPARVVERVGTGSSGMVSICYEPSSVVRWTVNPLATAAQNFSTLNTNEAAGGGLLFAVGLYDRNRLELANTPRVILYPLGGTPRRLR